MPPSEFSEASPRVVFDRRDPNGAPEISFIVPVYNEISSAASVLDALRGLPLSSEILVVDDGSTDGTRDLLSGYAGDSLVLLFHPANRGKGSAVRTALGWAKGRYVAIQDADLEYDPREYVALLTELKRSGARALFGSRFLAANPNIYRRYLWGNKLLTGTINTLCGSAFTDSYTCYKLMETALMRDLGLASRGFELEAEISAKIALRRVPYAERPIGYRPRRLEEGKKIGWKDAFKGMRTIFLLWWREGNQGSAGERKR